MVKDKIDIFNLGLCPKCLNTVTRLENSAICTCDCGERSNFHIAHLLLVEAIYQGRNDTLKRIVEILPDFFPTSRTKSGIASKDLLGCLELKNIKKKPSLFRAIIEEGSEQVSDLMVARQMEIKAKHGIQISHADAATIIAFKNIMRTFEEGEGDLTQNITAQDLNDLEKNEAGEFALSFIDINKCWIKAGVESSNSISACQPDIDIRYENEGEQVFAYIKSDLDAFVVVYRSINFPRGSKIYIFHKGAVAS